MPSLPSSLAGGFEKLTTRLRCIVRAADRISEGLMSIELEADGDGSTLPAPGTHFGIRVSDKDFRHYTVFDTRPDRLRCIIDLASGGPGAHWASNLAGGTVVPVLAPGGKLTATTGPHIVIAGDATAIASLRLVQQESRSKLCALEVHPNDVAAASELVPHATVLAATADPGAGISDWLRSVLDSHSTIQGAFLVGHAQSITRHRTFIRARTDLERKQIRTQAFWATGRAGL